MRLGPTAAAWRKSAAFSLCLLVGCGGSPFSASSSSTSGSGGATAGAAGTGNAAGEPSIDEPSAGSTSTAAAGGAAGEARGGASSDGGAVGAAGEDAGGAAPACPSATATDYQVGFFPELRTASSQEIHPFFKLSTTGVAVALERLSLRYYFSKEVDASETGSCYWVTGDHCASVHLTWHDVETPTPSADRYLELRFDGEKTKLTSLEPIEVRVGFFAAQKLMLQSNDYSFDANALVPTAAVKFPYKPWPRVTLYIDGQLAWGSEPCPSVVAAALEL